MCAGSDKEILTWLRPCLSLRQVNRIDYIEFVVGDIARSKKFYMHAFGWEFTDYGPDYSSFVDGRIAGGFTTDGELKMGGPLIVLFSDNLKTTMARVQAAGGVITRAPFDFPGGWRFHFTDPDGYELSVWAEKYSA